MEEKIDFDEEKKLLRIHRGKFESFVWLGNLNEAGDWR